MQKNINMKNQNNSQSELTVGHENRKVLSGIALSLGALLFGLMSACTTSTSRPSTAEEISTQMESQMKWDSLEVVAEKRLDSTLKAERKLNIQ